MKPRLIVLKDSAPLISFRLVFHTGAADDPVGRPGTASLLATLLSQGGTVKRPYQEILAALFPIASSVDALADKEMITFVGECHVETLEQYYSIFKDMLLQPGWREDDFERVRDDAVNAIVNGIRSSNDEEFAKEALYEEIYREHPYGKYSGGSVTSLNAIAVNDLRSFYAEFFTQSRLTIALGGGIPDGFAARVLTDFESLPEGEPAELTLPVVEGAAENRAVLIEKESRSVAMSIGIPITVRRGDPDYLPLVVAQSYFGQHRMGGRLFDRIREVRGLNYGDYCYLEYFPFGMYLLQPLPNVARRHQLFQIWIRPVERDKAQFALRLALYEWDRLVREGLTAEEFAQARAFLTKNVLLLTPTKSSELGYTVDSLFYGTDSYANYVREGIAKLTASDVQQAVQRHLSSKGFVLAAVGPAMERFREELSSAEPSTIAYATPPDADVLAEDVTVASWPLHLKAGKCTVRLASELFA